MLQLRPVILARLRKNETQKAAFTNTYSVSGKVKIEVKKDFNDWRAGDNFVFKLSGDGIDQGNDCDN